MIGLLDIFTEKLLKELGANPSIIRLRTSEPKYLIFSDSSNTPKYVLLPGSKNNLTAIRDYTFLLHQSLPGRIPEPLAILRDHNIEHYLVQRGIEGVPWFTLRQRLGKDIPWDSVVQLSLNALTDFHAATSSKNLWGKYIDLQSLFKTLYHRSNAPELTTLKGSHTVFNYCTSVLTDFSPMLCFLQHGDFCVNNLIYRDDSAGIIDFEHFGRVYLPMHDEFLLIGSLLELHDSPCADLTNNLWSQALEFSQYKFPKNSEILDVLLIMHILWWLVEIRGHDRRLERENTYLLALEHAHEEILKGNSGFVENILITISR